MKSHRLRLTAGLVLAAWLIAGCDRFTSVETRVARATASLQAGEYASALIDVRKALEAEPGNVGAQVLLADVLAASGELREALAQLERAAGAGAAVEDVASRRISLLLQSGDSEGAERALAQAATLSELERARFEGRLAIQRNSGSAALTAFERALASRSDDREARLGRIEALALLGRRDEAMREVDALLEDDPDFAPAYIARGDLELQQARFLPGAKAYEAALESGSGLPRLVRLRVRSAQIVSLLAAAQLDEARQALSALEGEAQSTPLLALMRARVALAGDDVSTAVNELRAFTRAVPDDLTGRMLLAGALLAQGNTEQAQAEIARATIEFPARDEPRLMLAELQMRRGRTLEAEEALRPLIARSPPNPQALALQGQLSIRQGEALAGLEFLEQGIAERPDDERLRLQLAAAQVAAGEPRRAIETLASIEEPSLLAARDRLRVIATAASEGPAAAEAQLRAAIARNPDDVDLSLMAASYYASTGDVERARRLLEEARVRRPEDSRLALALARLELSARRLDPATSLTEAVLARSPTDLGAMTLMAAIASERGNVQEADGWLDRARIAHPNALGIRVALARRELAKGDREAAGALIAEAERAASGDVGALVTLAELNAAAGRTTEALKQLDQAEARRPDTPAILLARARVHLAAGNGAAARDSLRRALKINPAWTPAATTLAALETSTGNLDAALRVTQDLRKSDPRGTTADILEADIYLGSKRPADAARLFAGAYARAPSSILAQRALQARRAAGDTTPERELADWVRRSPTDAPARRALAEHYMQTGRSPLAIAELERVIELRPDDPVALNNLAWLYHEARDERALAIAERAVAAAPGVPEIQDTRGVILLAAGRHAEALEVLRKAAQDSGRNADIQYHFAQALVANDRKDEARALLERLTDSPQLDPQARARARQLLDSLTG
jgi:putative PEP-CTERM system TPR-repeat lipoprotein